MCYDAAGNMKRDKHVTNAAWMTYDGENKMGRYDPDDAQTSPAFYLYDADGKRKQVKAKPRITSTASAVSC